MQLPIAQYPQIAPPTVLVTATFPGASAETLAKTVAAPIEEELSGIENLLYFSLFHYFIFTRERGAREYELPPLPAYPRQTHTTFFICLLLETTTSKIEYE